MKTNSWFDEFLWEKVRDKDMQRRGYRILRVQMIHCSHFVNPCGERNTAKSGGYGLCIPRSDVQKYTCRSNYYTHTVEQIKQ